MPWLVAIGLASVLLGIALLFHALRRFDRAVKLHDSINRAIVAAIIGGAFVGNGLLVLAACLLFFMLFGG